MKFSLKWLSSFIEVKDFFNEPEKLARVLTQAGLEVDSFEDQKNQFKNIVVAKIESIDKHSQADRLSLCQVFDGSKNYNVVCGANNYQLGDKVVLARQGAVLPNDLKIKKSRIRGIDSEGMLASRKELGLEQEDKEKGIWILPKEVELGINLSQYLGLEDIIFDISVPPNRSDCLSHRGLAREISGLFSRLFLEKSFSLNTDSSLSVQKSIKVDVKDSQACPRYCGRLIEGVQVKESPAWLKEQLKSLGLKSINNVVDISNFVLWDRGQALHIFDRDKIQSLSVNKSKKGEKFYALDERELILTGEELTIRDKDRAVALAGVMGGMDSSVTQKTRNVFIEAAGFAPEKIRRTSRHFGLETDSSYLFSRGIDLLAVKETMDFACFLIQKEAGGKISKDFYDISHQKVETCNIKISLEDLEDRLGYKVSSSEFQNDMKKIGCKVKSKKQGFEVLAPSYRQDLKIKEDLIEELARLEGYDKVPEKLVSLAQTPKESNFHFLNSRKLITFLSGKGLYQAINYSFCDPDYYKEFLKEDFYLDSLGKNLQSKKPTQIEEKKTVVVNNPISRQLSLMKPCLTPDLVRNVVNNFRHNNKFGRIFELSPVFYQGEKQYKQEVFLACAFWGEPIDIWQNQPVPNFYFMKSVLESLFEVFCIKACLWKSCEVSFLHPKKSLILSHQNKVIGFLGSLHPHLLKKYKLPVDVTVAEMNWEYLESLPKKTLKFKSLSHLLTVEKDLCFVIPSSILVDDVRQEIKNKLGALCEEVEIFDIYESKEQRSVSFRMYLIPEDKSWTDEQFQILLNGVIEAVYKKFSIRLK